MGSAPAVARSPADALPRRLKQQRVDMTTHCNTVMAHAHHGQPKSRDTKMGAANKASATNGMAIEVQGAGGCHGVPSTAARS